MQIELAQFSTISNEKMDQFVSLEYFASADDFYIK